MPNMQNQVAHISHYNLQLPTKHSAWIHKKTHITNNPLSLWELYIFHISFILCKSEEKQKLLIYNHRDPMLSRICLLGIKSPKDRVELNSSINKTSKISPFIASDKLLKGIFSPFSFPV